MKTDDVFVKKSRIEGKGVFASRAYKKGEIVLHWDINHPLTDEEYNKLTEKEKGYVSFIDGKYIVMQEPEKFVNHSCSPNTTAKGFCDIATKDIEKGEEITEDYSEGFPPGAETKCNCGSSNCRKIIKNEKNCY
jgi:SET domain-containing protein